MGCLERSSPRHLEVPLGGPELPRGAGRGTGCWEGREHRRGHEAGKGRRCRPRDGPGCGVWGATISGCHRRQRRDQWGLKRAGGQGFGGHMKEARKQASEPPPSPRPPAHVQRTCREHAARGLFRWLSDHALCVEGPAGRRGPRSPQHTPHWAPVMSPLCQHPQLTAFRQGLWSGTRPGPPPRAPHTGLLFWGPGTEAMRWRPAPPTPRAPSISTKECGVHGPGPQLPLSKRGLEGLGHRLRLRGMERPLE